MHLTQMRLFDTLLVVGGCHETDRRNPPVQYRGQVLRLSRTDALAHRRMLHRVRVRESVPHHARNQGQEQAHQNLPVPRLQASIQLDSWNYIPRFALAYAKVVHGDCAHLRSEERRISLPDAEASRNQLPDGLASVPQ